MTEPLITLFTWGYWGWGRTADRFVEAADAMERARGFAPPLFVDVRIRRGVRALGFKDRAFEQTVGHARYVWMPSLGNNAVLERTSGIRIKDPAAAGALLDLALERSLQRQRLLFFCSCERPGREDHEGCHRTAVARLVLEEAGRRKIAVETIEWPGGEPGLDLRVAVSANEMKTLKARSKSIRLREPASLADIAGIPWYSPATIYTDEGEPSLKRVLTGPGKYKAKTGWSLPRLCDLELKPSAEVMRRAQQMRATGGFEGRSTLSHATGAAPAPA